jgi:predicted DNA-binding antitoxin AbrB/MazE fold protein
MTYKGHVKNGVVVLDEPADLPDGAEVQIELAAEEQTLYERLKDVIGIVKGLPPDFAEQHDHYIHGKPKH